MADIVLCIASTVAGYLVAPVGRQCGYVIRTNSYVDELKEERVQLEKARERVQHSVDEARRNMKRIEADVEEWVKNVETVANKVDVLDYEARSKKTCFCGWLPNPKERYCLGRDARKTVQDIKALILQGKFGRVYYENPPSGRVGGASDVNSTAGDGGNTIVDSRASIFQEIMKALDDEKHKVIGVYGPGGVGKTTLLKEVENQLRKKKRPFHMIAKAEVSQKPETRKIQDDIAYALGLELKDVPSEEGRRALLSKRLQKDPSEKNEEDEKDHSDKKDPSEKIIVILDDLWEELDLGKVGIPTGDESRACKLLLSSRSKDVLEQRMQAYPTFHLEGLREDEAFRLFEGKVGNKLQDDDELKAKAAQVVRKLAGLPLLIESVASTIKCSGVSTWDSMLTKIEDPNTERIVKWSYDHLRSEDAKSLFLLCGLIGGTIQVELLLGLGMGLGLFEGFNRTMEGARCRLNTTLDNLRSACLLLEGGEDKENVTIHDLYSEEVVSTPFEGQNSLIMNNNSWSEEKLEKCWAICLLDVGSDKLAELMQCEFLKLKILMLSQPEDQRGRPAHRHVGDCCRLDFTCMKQLRVLYIRSMHIPNLPSSIQIPKNFRSLYLEHCDVEDVAILGKLEGLQILSFAGSKISRLPKEIGKLTKLRLLNLNDCRWLKIIDPGVLKGLVNLEELNMKGSFGGWMGKDEIPSESRNARFSELKSLTRLTALEISIPDPTMLLEDGDLPFGNLIRFWINIGDVQILDLHRRCSMGECEGLRTMKLNLKGRDSIRDSILSKKWVQKTLSKAESLFLMNIVNLENIWNGRVTPDCLRKLKAVHIMGCHQLKNLWSLSEMQRLVHLEEILVRECDSLQAIITYDGGELEVAADDGVKNGAN